MRDDAAVSLIVGVRVGVGDEGVEERAEDVDRLPLTDPVGDSVGE